MQARFSDPVLTDSEAHPATFAMGVRYFPGVNRPGRGSDHPLSSSVEVAKRLEMYFRPHFALA